VTGVQAGSEALGSGLAAFVAGMPKAELHVHHVGSASPAVVAGLAARYEGRTEVPTDPVALAKYFEFTDFAHFIQVYLSVVDLIRDAADVRALTYGVAEDMARQNIRYAELTVTPYSSVKRGIPGEAFMEAIEDARKAAEAELGVVLRWCFDIPGEAGIESAEVTERLALDLRPEGLVSFGLGGPEVGVSRGQFQPFFDRARAAGLHSVPHAGEARCSSSARSGSATAPPRCRTRAWWTTWASTGSRWRSARPPTSPPGWSSGSRSTRSGRWWTPGFSSPSTATTRRCSAPT